MKCNVARGEFSRRRRVLAVSDVHGRPDLLRRLLEKLDYRPGKDGLVLVGDLLEKGPDSLGALRMAMDLMREDRVYVLRGNCDTALLDPADPDLPALLARQTEADGFLWQLAAAQGLARQQVLADVPAAVRRLQAAYPAETAFLRALPDILETEDYRFVHAGLCPGPLESQPWEEALTVRGYLDRAEKSEKLLVVGHFPVSNYTARRRGVLGFAPFCDAEKNILSIDGGLCVKEGGQLNGTELWEGAYRRYSCVDGLGRAVVRKGRKAAQEESIAWIWPDLDVDVLERDEEREALLCRHQAAGQTAWVPAKWVRQGPSGARLAGDYTSLRLALKGGDRVSVVCTCGGQTLVKKDSILGWTDTDQLEFIPPAHG